MEALLEGPTLLLAVAAVVAAVVLGMLFVRWRREAAMREHASEQGWQPVDQTTAFGGLVADAFPEMREEVEQRARSSRRSGGRRGAGGGLSVSLTSPSTRSRTRARSVYVAPVPSGELAAGDVTITASAGKLSHGRASAHHGAVAGRLSGQLPALRLRSRSRLDRGGDESLPDELASRFTALELADEGKAVYVDSGAWRPLVDAAAELDGVAVDGETVVLLSSKRLTPDRATALADAAQQFVAEAAARADDAAGGTSSARLTSPVSAG